MTEENLKLGALGGPSTFGAQAAHILQEKYPEFTEILYYPTSGEALDRDDTPNPSDASCAPEQMKRTGFHSGSQGRIISGRYVAGEVSHAYHACLLVKPGTRLEDVREVQGHTGSITQSEHWLKKNLPQATITIVDTSSHGAAQAVTQSDGSVASVGTEEMARQWGLEQAAMDVDEGSVANYWAISKRPIYDENPTRVIVTVRSQGEGILTDVILALSQLGWRVQTIYSRTTGQALFEHDYNIRFSGSTTLQSVQQALSAFPTARLAGAFRSRE